MIGRISLFILIVTFPFTGEYDLIIFSPLFYIFVTFQTVSHLLNEIRRSKADSAKTLISVLFQ